MKKTPPARPSASLARVQWFDDRFYRRTINPDAPPLFYPSATTILGIVAKPYLADFRGRVGNEEAEYRSYLAKTRGTLAHEIIHRLLKGERVERGDTDQTVWLQVCNFREWFAGLGAVRVIAAEETVFSDLNKFAGTVDAVLEVDGAVLVVDFKTGKGRDKAYAYQVAAYAAAWEEMYPESKVAGTVVVYLNGGKATTSARTGSEVGADFDVFCHALEMYLAINEARPRVFDMPNELQLKIQPKKPNQSKPKRQTNGSGNVKQGGLFNRERRRIKTQKPGRRT